VDTIRALLLIAVVVLMLLAVGVLRYRSSQDEVTITIDKQKGRETTAQVIEKGKELGSKIAEQAKRTSEKPTGSAPQ
jgi:transposase